MAKILVFDLDGTIVDFYGVEGWLDDIHKKSARPYQVARPLYDMEDMALLLNLLRDLGWQVVVTSWLADGSTKEYDAKVRKAKLEWLERYHFPYDEIHLVKYGTTKANCTRKKGGYQLLFDDNENVRKGWTLGDTFDAHNNILEKLADLLCNE